MSIAEFEQQKVMESRKELSSELLEPRWSVISFEKCEASGLTYAAALQKMAELESNRISGLCIVTDETAQKVGSGSRQ